MLAERKKTALYARLSKDDLEDAVSTGSSTRNLCLRNMPKNTVTTIRSFMQMTDILE